MSNLSVYSFGTARGKKLRVLHVTPCFYPATIWGGPIFSTKAICDQVGAMEDFHLRVLTTDTAGTERTMNLVLDERTQVFPAGYEVHYAKRIVRNSTSPQLLRNLPAQIRWADVVHLTAVYNFPTIPTLLLARMMRKPVVWSPRGALQASAEWAQAPSKRAKRLFEWLVHAIAPRDMILHVTAATEAAATAVRFPGVRCQIVPNSVEIPDSADLQPREWRPQGRLRLAFLSRIHKKKGLELLLKALAGSPATFELAIYGHGSDDYLAQLSDKVQELGLSGRVKFHGHVEGESKRNAFKRCDLFVLPSYSENFGIAVAEALAHGVPVLTTTATPWANISTHGCGAIVEPEADALKAALLCLSQADLSKMGQQGRNWMIGNFSPEAVNSKMIDLYRKLASGQKPKKDWKG